MRIRKVFLFDMEQAHESFALEFFDGYLHSLSSTSSSSSTVSSSLWEDLDSLSIMKTIVKMSSSDSRCPSSVVSVDDFEARYKLGLTFEPSCFNVKLIRPDSQGLLSAELIGWLKVRILPLGSWLQMLNVPCISFRI